MADVIYNSFKKKLLDGSIDLVNDTIKFALVTSAYTPDQDLHTDFDDITNELPTANGYTANGATIANPANTQDNTDNEGVYDGDNVTWTGASFTARGAVLYKYTGTPSTSSLIMYIDFTEDKTPDAGDFVVDFNVEGILNIG
jgi:hypothetical protein